MKCTNEACPYRQEPGPVECPAANNGCGGYQGDLLKDPHYIRMTHPVLIDTEEDADKLVQAIKAISAPLRPAATAWLAPLPPKAT